MPPRRAPRGRGRGRTTPYDTPDRSTAPVGTQGGGDREVESFVCLANDGPEGGNNTKKSLFSALFPMPDHVSDPCRSMSQPYQERSSLNVDFELPPAAFRCADDSLTMHVPKETIHKIWSGEYVNLSILLNKGVEHNSSSTFSINEKGELEIKKKSAKAITTIREWTDAFLVFAAIVIQKSPELALDLLQYMSLIREAETRSHGSMAWLSYDESFRMRQAIYPQSWSKINSDLWLRAMTLPAFPQPSIPMSYKSNNLPAFPQPTTPTSPRFNNQPKPFGNICFEFNSLPGCTFKKCRYLHVCLACRGPHKQQECLRMNLGPNFRKPANPGRPQTFQLRSGQR